MELKIKLKIIYSILKEFSEGNKAIDQETYDINYNEFLSILEFMVNEGLVRNVVFAHSKGEPSVGWWDNAEVTMKGLHYLQENSSKVKIYKTLKEVREWLPL